MPYKDYEKQKEWDKGLKWAEKVDIEQLKNRRPTPAQRKEWQNKIILAEQAQAK